MADWAHVFVGRDDELAILKQAYQEAAAGKTRVVSIVAESGFGKTRLVQEFYSCLSINHDAGGEGGYWPDKLHQRDDNLLINPEIRECGATGKQMPFLWWGLRLSDPSVRNEIVAGALWAGIDILKPHLGSYARAAERDKILAGTIESLKSGVFDLALEAIGNAVSFGLLGTGKTVLETGKELYNLSREHKRLTTPNVSLAIEKQGANDELTNTIVADLSLIAKNPPKGISVVPLVIFLDDAQWVAHDSGMGAFVKTLLDRAREESWPLLLIMTCWEREWQNGLVQGLAPASLLKSDQGDIVLELSRTRGLEAILAIALPGVTARQRAAVLEQTDGNPRFLEEILLFLHRNPKFFVDRELTNALTPKGMDVLSSWSFPDFVGDRFAEAPEHVRRALSLASLHGVNFSPRIVQLTAEHLALDDASMGLTEGQNPHGFASIRDDLWEGEFRLRAYRNAAADDLDNHFDEDEVQTALAYARSKTLADLGRASERDLTVILQSAIEEEVVWASAELIRRAQRRSDPRTAGEIAQDALPLLTEAICAARLSDVVAITFAHWEWVGPTDEVREPLMAVLNQARADFASNPNEETRGQLIAAISCVGDIAETLEGPAAAQRYREEEIAICRAMAAATDHLEARRQLANAVSRLARLTEKLKGPAAARPYREEEAIVFRALAEANGTLESRRELAIALSHLGDVVEDLEGPAAAKEHRSEALALFRAVAQVENSADTRRNLSIALGKYGKVIEALEGPKAARVYREDQTTLCRALAIERATPAGRVLLAAALAGLGNLVEAADGPRASRPFRDEEVALSRALAAQQNTPDARASLASAISNLANIVEAVEGSGAAKEYREEVATLSRALAVEQQTPAAKQSLALALARLGDTVWTLHGPKAAKPYWEEHTDLCRLLVAEQGTPAARSSFALALARLGNVHAALDGPDAGRPYHEEETGLWRALAAEQDTPAARRGLAKALARLGETVLATRGPREAKPYWEENTALCRRLEEELDTPGARMDLARALNRLGGNVEVLAGSNAAKPLREEVVVLWRNLVAEFETPDARFGLAQSLAQLGDVIAALEGPAAARPIREEQASLCRALVGENDTPGNRRMLATSLARLGGSIDAIEGSAAARAYRDEETTLFRTLASEQDTPSARADLAAAVGRLGNAVEAIEGPSAARPYWEEEVALCRSLGAEQKNHGTQRRLAHAIARIAGAIDALDGPAKAKPYLVEGVALYRDLAADQGTPGARVELAGGLARLARVVEALESPAKARALREEARAIIATDLTMQASTHTRLADLVLRQDLLRGKMLGHKPWEIPFALEVIEAECARGLMDEVADLLISFQEWSQLVGDDAALGWTESCLADLASCYFATGEYQRSERLLDEIVASARKYSVKIPNSGRVFLSAILLLLGRCKSATHQHEEATKLFEEASASIVLSKAKRTPIELRSLAAIKWFYAKHLLALKDNTSFADVIAEGAEAAHSFAEFRMLDSQAILSAYRNQG